MGEWEQVIALRLYAGATNSHLLTKQSFYLKKIYPLTKAILLYYLYMYTWKRTFGSEDKCFCSKHNYLLPVSFLSEMSFLPYIVTNCHSSSHYSPPTCMAYLTHWVDLLLNNYLAIWELIRGSQEWEHCGSFN